MSDDKRPILGISMGDPGGIGPEICVKALAEKDIHRMGRLLVVGETAIVENAVRFCGLGLKVNKVIDPGRADYREGVVNVLEQSNLGLENLQHKQVTAGQGKAAFDYVAKVIQMALEGNIQGTVTGPISKEAINAAGFKYAGHTEIYADLTQTKDYAMMLADGDFRVVHVSTHVSLREACDRVKKDRVLRTIELTEDILEKLGLSQRRIGVAGLNPHCGEGGMFGTEDEEEIRPAVESAREKKIDAEGPIPADTIFSKMRGGMYDAVVVMYHDQGHIPAKLVGFHYDAQTGTWGAMAGVNITLGIPIVRVSVDHGTAFGKAGEGRANPQSMIEAIKIATQLSRKNLPWSAKTEKVL